MATKMLVLICVFFMKCVLPNEFLFSRNGEIDIDHVPQEEEEFGMKNVYCRMINYSEFL